MPDVTYDLLWGKKKGKKRKLNVGLAFTALPAQVSIRLASELALKIPKFPQSELIATITHSYGASDGRRQKIKAVVLVPFPAQKAKVISRDTSAHPGQCQPGAAGEGRARGLWARWMFSSRGLWLSKTPRNYMVFFSLRITIQRQCHSPSGDPKPSDTVYCWQRNASRGSGTRSGPIRTTVAPCLPWGSRHRTVPSTPAQLSVPRTAAFLRARSPSSSTSSPQGFNCPSECLWVRLAAVSTSLFICREERGEGQLCVGVMWFLSRKTPGGHRIPAELCGLGTRGHCLVLCGDEGEAGVCYGDLTVEPSPTLGASPEEADLTVPLQHGLLLRAQLCCPPVGCSAQRAVWDRHVRHRVQPWGLCYS